MTQHTPTLTRFERRQRLHQLEQMILTEQDPTKRADLKAERLTLWKQDALGH